MNSERHVVPFPKDAPRQSGRIGTVEDLRRKPQASSVPVRSGPLVFTGDRKADENVRKTLLARIQQKSTRIPNKEIPTNESLRLSSAGSSRSDLICGDSFSISDSSDLVSLMAARLNEVEKTVKLQRKELAARNKVVADLNLRLQESEIELQELRKRTYRLQQENEEIINFLHDYDLEWVGDKHTTIEVKEVEAPVSVKSVATGTSTQLIPKQSPPVEANVQFSFDISKIKKVINELNIIAGEDVSTFRSSSNKIHRLHKAESLPLSIFKDGIFLQNGPFRSFSTSSARSFIRDLNDGFFPKELQSRFPNGVPFHLFDRTDEEYNHEKHSTIHRFTIQPIASPANAKSSEKKTPNATQGNYGTAISNCSDREVFLRAIPDVVVKDNRLISVKKQIIEAMDGRTQSTKEVLTHAEGEESVKIKVQFVSLGKTVLLSLLPQDTIGLLREFLNPIHSRSCKRECKYTLFTSYPKVVLRDDTETVFNANIGGSLLYAECTK